MRFRFAGFCALALAAPACVHVSPTPGGPESVAREYARLLSEGDLESAQRLTSGLDRQSFQKRYADPAARARRGAEVSAAAGGVTGPAGAVALQFGGSGWTVREEPDREDASLARRTLAEFLDAAERRDFTVAWSMLSARWRGRYTPARLETDFDAEPLVKERLARARAALAGPWQVGNDGAELKVAEGRTLRLEREGQLLKVAALE